MKADPNSLAGVLKQEGTLDRDRERRHMTIEAEVGGLSQLGSTQA